MAKKIDLTGKKFGRLTVIRQAGDSVNGKPIPWLCRCSCGKEKVIISPSLRYGKSKSCGCWKDEKTSERFRKYPKGYEHLDDVLRQMVKRCTDPNHPDYQWYGARGIEVCPEWSSDLNIFIEWARSSGYKKGLSIDRINNDGNYCPDNCRWATDREQANNRSSNHVITYMGTEYTLSEAARHFGINERTLRARIERGWSPERAIQEPAWVGKNQYD